jgi:cysteine desulfurase
MDTQASAMMDPRVVDAMIPQLLFSPGNPHGHPHDFAAAAHKSAEGGRNRVAELIGCAAKDVIFTSGATEANNLAIKGSMRFLRTVGKTHVITSSLEHKCVLESVRDLQVEGFEATIINPRSDGLIDPSDIAKAIKPTTGLVSVMLLNNEIGTIQPVEEIAKIAKDAGVWVHSDAAQACGKIPVDVGKLGVQLLSVSGHKMHGPKGVGALYLASRPRVRLSPILVGGGQERGMRSGTLAVPLAVGIGRAAEIGLREMAFAHDHVTRLGKHLIARIVSEIEAVTVNGSTEDGRRYFGCVNVSFEGVEGESLMTKMRGISVSSGSACTSASLEPSYVLRAIGVSDELAHTSLRIGISKFTREDEVDRLMDALKRSVKELRAVSLLWDLKKRGIDVKNVKWIH